MTCRSRTRRRSCPHDQRRRRRGVAVEIERRRREHRRRQSEPERRPRGPVPERGVRRETGRRPEDEAPAREERCGREAAAVGVECGERPDLAVGSLAEAFPAPVPRRDAVHADRAGALKGAADDEAGDVGSRAVGVPGEERADVGEARRVDVRDARAHREPCGAAPPGDVRDGHPVREREPAADVEERRHGPRAVMVERREREHVGIHHRRLDLSGDARSEGGPRRPRPSRDVTDDEGAGEAERAAGVESLGHRAAAVGIESGERIDGAVERSAEDRPRHAVPESDDADVGPTRGKVRAAGGELGQVRARAVVVEDRELRHDRARRRPAGARLPDHRPRRPAPAREPVRGHAARGREPAADVERGRDRPGPSLS